MEKIKLYDRLEKNYPQPFQSIYLHVITLQKVDNLNVVFQLFSSNFCKYETNHGAKYHHPIFLLAIEPKHQSYNS